MGRADLAAWSGERHSDRHSDRHSGAVDAAASGADWAGFPLTRGSERGSIARPPHHMALALSTSQSEGSRRPWRKCPRRKCPRPTIFGAA